MDTILKTERLVLRPFEQRDAPRIETLAGDWDVARMTALIPHPYLAGAASTWIASHALDRTEGTHFRFAVTLDGDCIGASGLHTAKGADWELPGDVLEIGYWVGKPYWGRGYASEAAAALLGFGFNTLGRDVLAAGHFADNPVSRHVLLKLGFVPCGQRRMKSLARGAEVDCPLLLLTRDTWLANSGIK